MMLRLDTSDFEAFLYQCIQNFFDTITSNKQAFVIFMKINTQLPSLMIKDMLKKDNISSTKILLGRFMFSQTVCWIFRLKNVRLEFEKICLF